MLSDQERIEKIEILLDQINEEFISSGRNFQELVEKLLELLPDCVRAIEIDGTKYGDSEAYETMTWDIFQAERFLESYRKSVGL